MLPGSRISPPRRPQRALRGCRASQSQQGLLVPGVPAAMARHGAAGPRGCHLLSPGTHSNRLSPGCCPALLFERSACAPARCAPQAQPWSPLIKHRLRASAGGTTQHAKAAPCGSGGATQHAKAAPCRTVGHGFGSRMAGIEGGRAHVQGAPVAAGGSDLGWAAEGSLPALPVGRRASEPQHIRHPIPAALPACRAALQLHDLLERPMPSASLPSLPAAWL